MVWSEGNMSLKNPVTPEIDPGTVRLVAQHINHCANPGPWCLILTFLKIKENYTKLPWHRTQEVIGCLQNIVIYNTGFVVLRKRNTGGCSRNQRCSGKNKYYIFIVSVALVIQHAKRLRLIVISGLSSCTSSFHIIS